MNKLANFRKILGLTQDEMAESMSVSKSLYSKVENGDRKASNNFITKLKRRYPEYDVNSFFNQ